MRRTIMGIPIDVVTRAEAVATVRRFLDEPRAHIVTTPNPEMLVDARRDAAFSAALRSADLAIPDGHGLVFISRLNGTPLPERVTGTDLVADLASAAAEKGKTVFLLGGQNGAGERAKAALVRAHPALRIVGVMEGGTLTRATDGAWQTPDDVLSVIRAAAPDILLVAFGHGKQETWISAHIADMPSVRVAVGIGGAFDFIGGRAQRAPAWMRALWLEWVWRLIREPRRLGRICKAAIVFPLLALTSKD